MPISNLRAILEDAAAQLGGSATARRDAELLLMRAAGRDRAWIMTHPEAALTLEQSAQFETWIARRARHEPIQYILGETEFYGLAFAVTPDVLIPRPETEHLVEAVIQKVPRQTPVRICDVGTGSGAIAVALAHALPMAQLTALDLSPSALAVAAQNTRRHSVADRIRFVESDLMNAVRGETFNVVVANPPYVRNDEALDAQVRDYEPHAALFAGPTGLEVYQRLIPQAHAVLASGGWLVMEIGHGQRNALRALLADWDAVDFIDDLQSIPRVAIARRPA